MVDKPRKPRGSSARIGKGPDKPRVGRVKDYGQDRPGSSRKASLGPAQNNRIAGVDRRSMELLEREGMLSGEGRRLLSADEGKGSTGRNPKSDRDSRAVPAGDRPRLKTQSAAFGPKRALGRRLSDAEDAVAQRLQKVMAQAGLASRRHSEELIQSGRVTVNGRVVTELGTKVIPGKDIVEVDGRPLSRPENLIHLVLNKPKGYVTTLYDPQGRPKVTDLLGDEIAQRVYPVGRLDYDTEGLLLLTNDGELANALMHPARQVKKTYIAKLRGVPGPAKLKALETGIELEDGPTAPADVKLIEARGPNSATVSIRIHEGRNRQVRRMFKAVDHEVIHLKRTTLGPLHLKDLPLGKWRELTQQELTMLRDAVGMKQSRAAKVASITEQRKEHGQRPSTDRRSQWRSHSEDAPRQEWGAPQERGARPQRGPSPVRGPRQERDVRLEQGPRQQRDVRLEQGPRQQRDVRLEQGPRQQRGARQERGSNPVFPTRGSEDKRAALQPPAPARRPRSHKPRSEK